MGYLTASKELIQLNIFISDLEENINSADNFANYTRIAGKERMKRTKWHKGIEDGASDLKH